MARQNYKTLVQDSTGIHEYSDWAIDEADLFDQYDQIFTGWALVRKDGNTYTIRYEKIR